MSTAFSVEYATEAAFSVNPGSSEMCWRILFLRSMEPCRVNSMSAHKRASSDGEMELEFLESAQDTF